jgi:hypothetical protein
VIIIPTLKEAIMRKSGQQSSRRHVLRGLSLLIALGILVVTPQLSKPDSKKITFDRNLNTAEHNGTSTKMQVAHQTIYHTKDYPSHVVLPIIPKK